MTAEVVFEPDSLDRYAAASHDVIQDLLAMQARYERAMALVHASGSWTAWTSVRSGFSDLSGERAALARLGDFTAWLAGRARDLDALHLGVARLPLAAVHDADLAAPLWDADMLEARGSQVAAALDGRMGPLTDGDLAMLGVFADDPDFAAGLVAGLGGPAGTVDALLAQHRRLASTDLAGEPLADTTSTRALATITVGLGTALGRTTLDAAWGAADTDGLVAMVRAVPGDEDWGPQRAAGLSVLVAAAPSISTEVVSALLSAAVAVDRTEGGRDAWNRRAAAPDTGQWQRLVDHQGHVADDPVSTLLLATTRHPEAALRALTTGGTIAHAGADGRERRVDATLAHLVHGRGLDDVGWGRLGTVLEVAVVDHTGTDDEGRSAASVTAQSVALLADRAGSGRGLPRPLHRATATLLATAMPGAVPALAGTDTTGWATRPTDWTTAEVPIYPEGLAVQPVLHTADLATVLDRLGASPHEVERLTTRAVATIDLAIANEMARSHPDLAIVAAAGAVSANAARTILDHARTGVATDHAQVEEARDRLALGGAVLSEVPVVGVVGRALESVAGFLIHEYATPEDYRASPAALRDLVGQRTLDALWGHGWFDDVEVPVDALRYRDGTPVGFDHDSTAFLEWATSSGDVPTWTVGHVVGDADWAVDEST